MLGFEHFLGLLHFMPLFCALAKRQMEYRFQCPDLRLSIILVSKICFSERSWKCFCPDFKHLIMRLTIIGGAAAPTDFRPTHFLIPTDVPTREQNVFLYPKLELVQFAIITNNEIAIILSNTNKSVPHYPVIKENEPEGALVMKRTPEFGCCRIRIRYIHMQSSTFWKNRNSYRHRYDAM